MTYLLAGLVLFLGVHSVRLFTADWRTQVLNAWGAGPWRAAYSLLSLAGLTLIIWGFGLVRQNPVQLWSPPTSMRHLAALLTLPAFVLLAAAYVPGNQIRARVHHPMVVGVMLWALAHLLSNGNVGHVLLFGTFLGWAFLNFLAAKRRDQRDGKVYAAGKAGATGITVAMGVAGWIAFTLWLHGWLIGVRPFG